MSFGVYLTVFLSWHWSIASTGQGQAWPGSTIWQGGQGHTCCHAMGAQSHVGEAVEGRNLCGLSTGTTWHGHDRSLYEFICFYSFICFLCFVFLFVWMLCFIVFFFLIYLTLLLFFQCLCFLARDRQVWIMMAVGMGRNWED